MSKLHSLAKKLKDKIPGGLADEKTPEDFDQKALSKGVKTEMEHTSDHNIAEEIAMDHLMEDPDYYEKLEEMEKRFMKPKKSHKELLVIIDSVKQKVKQSDVYKDMCEENGVEIDYIDLVPMAFEDIEVSARTNKGCIYFNYALIDDGDFESEDHYMIHELTHHFQQCFGDGPTQGSTKDSYLDNEFEQEGFQAQTEYLSETRDDETAEKYVTKVLDHHEVPESERDKRREDLLNLAVEVCLKKKEAGLFKVPKAWTDKLEKVAFENYAAQVWRRCLELTEEGAGTKRPDGSVDVLGNDALIDLYYKSDNNGR
jgi:hypothetical protein